MSRCFVMLFSLLLWAGLLPLVQAEEVLEEVVVTAGFRDSELMKSAGSISVLDSQVLTDRSARHFEQSINMLPNVSSASGGSRARFVQVRGVGDLEQFVDPKHFPSVGITIDGIEVGTTATGAVLMDVEQVEVLRGPQGTRFGANALAGMVNIRTREATDEFSANIYGGYGNLESWQLGAAVSGPLSDSLKGRLAIQQTKSDGHYKNDFLDRDDTNQRDELALRGKLRWSNDRGTEIDAIVAYVDLDGGYDAFSLDNVPRTISDNPGMDQQETIALAVKARVPVFEGIQLEGTVSWQDSDEDYGFDEDWVFSGFCDGIRCDPLFEFTSTDQLQRQRDVVSLDLRLLSDDSSLDWVLGFYAQSRNEDLQRKHFVAFNSDYETERYALYGQLQFNLTEKLQLTTGLRFEHFSDDYNDSNAVPRNSSDNYWSGRLNLEYFTGDDALFYLTLSRSVKPGGVNTETSSSFPVINPAFQPFLLERRTFAKETLFNKEIGIKTRMLDDRLALRLSLFHMDRDNAQLESFVWDATTFIFTGFLDSNSDAENYGAELEVSLELTSKVRVFSNIGYLETSVDELNVFDLDLNQFATRNNRDQAKAPKWQYHAGVEVNFSEKLRGRMEVEGRDDSLFGYYHNGSIDGYTLVNASLEYNFGKFNIQGWVRNLFDENYQVHGLYFANDPRDLFSVNRAYYQFGEPRVYGVNFSYQY